MRIARALALAGIDSRRKCETYIRNGAVAVNGEVVGDLGRQVDLEEDAVTFRGRLLRFEKYVYYILHKPVGYTTTAADPHARKTVFELLPRLLVSRTRQTSAAPRTRVFPVGRLDRDSSGLLLFTNDGDLANRLIHPRYQIGKWYEVRLDRPFDPADGRKLLAGIMLEEGKAQVEKFHRTSRRGIRLLICEGKKREVRRIFEKLGYKVVSLCRIAFGPLVLAQMPPGHGRFLKSHEVRELKKAILRAPGTLRSCILTLFLLSAFSSIFFIPLAWSMGKRPPKETKEVSAEAAKVKAPPLTLEDCFRLALARSETLAIREEEIKKTTAQFFKATSQALGTVDFVATDFHQDPQGESTTSGSSVGGTLSASERRERKITIAQPIFQGFKSIGALAGAGSLKNQRTAERDRASQLLFLDVANAFYTVLKNEKDVRTIEGIHQSYEERIGDLTAREKIGRSRMSEVATAKTQMKILESQLASARGAFEISKHLLEFLAGIPISEERLIEEEIPAKTFDEIDPSEIAAGRADVEAARQAMKAAGRNIVIAQSSLWPRVTLEHNQYEHREGFQSGINWDLLFKINVPFFQGGGAIGELKDAISEWKKSRFAYSLAKRKAELEIKDAYQDWISSHEQYEALEDAVKVSQENFLLQKDEYSRNLVGNLDVLSALQSLFETRRNANQAFYQMKQNFWQLRIAMGECCESL